MVMLLIALIALLRDLFGRRKRPVHKTPEMFAEYRPPPDPRRKEFEKQIALSWLALRNAERNGDWLRASVLARATIPRLERELELLSVQVPGKKS